VYSFARGSIGVPDENEFIRVRAVAAVATATRLTSESPRAFYILLDVYY